jgi:hypothetical protein
MFRIEKILPDFGRNFRVDASAACRNPACLVPIQICRFTPARSIRRRFHVHGHLRENEFGRLRLDRPEIRVGDR